MRWWHVTWCLVVIAVLRIEIVIAIKKLGNCRAQMDNGGGIVDLSSVDKSPKIFETSTWRFEFNPCTPVSCSGPNAVICQNYIETGEAFVLGDLNTVLFSMQGTTLQMTYTSSTKKSIVNCLCSEFENFKFLNEFPKENYKMEFNHPCCCPNRCKAVGPGDDGLSFGTILLIFFFSSLVVYFVGGILFNKYVRKTDSLEVPNKEFWRELPGYIKDGYEITAGMVKTKILKQAPENQYAQI